MIYRPSVVGIDFVNLINDAAKPKKPVDFTYRLYYNKETGEPLFYSMEDLDGDYIKVTQEQHSRGRYDILVRKGKIVRQNDAVSWTKLAPSETGTGCRANNVMIVDNNSDIKWASKTYYLK